jgi:hypothetical protein
MDIHKGDMGLQQGRATSKKHEHAACISQLNIFRDCTIQCRIHLIQFREIEIKPDLAAY